MGSPPIADPKKSIVYIGLGSNLGHREETLRSAIAGLQQIGEVNKISSFYETEPVGEITQPDFINAVVELQTSLAPEDLLAALLRIEQAHGRDRLAGPPKGPRKLDLDLLAYDDLVMDTPSLTLPHPALDRRGFVLIPLAEIVPEWRHPITGKTASQLLLELSSQPAPPGSHNVPSVKKIDARQQSS